MNLQPPLTEHTLPCKDTVRSSDEPLLPPPRRALVVATWTVVALGSGGTEQTSSAADSALFASMGVWISPFTVRLYAVLALLFTYLVVGNVASGFYKIYLGCWTGNLSTAFGFAAVAVLLRAGRAKGHRCVLHAAPCARPQGRPVRAVHRLSAAPCAVQPL